MPLDDDETLDAPPPRREDLLAAIHAECLTEADEAAKTLKGLQRLQASDLGGEAVSATLLALLVGQEQVLRKIANLCGVIDRVRRGKPLPPAHPVSDC